MRLVVLALLVIASSAQACSIAYQEFSQADAAEGRVVTNLGQDVVSIDFAGDHDTLVEEFFPHVRASFGYTVVQYQEGLGADCSGDRFLKVFNDGALQRTHADVDTFDMDGFHVAYVWDNDVVVKRVNTWQTIGDFEYPRGNAEGPFGGSGQHPSIAVDEQNERVAISDANGVIRVYGYQGELLKTLDAADNRPLLDWHDDTLIVADSNGMEVTFSFIAWGGDARFITLSSDDYEPTAIAVGDKVYLQHGNAVIRADEQPDRLQYSGNHDVGTIAADRDLYVLMLDDFDAIGIKDMDGSWYAAPDWQTAAGPSFSWVAGPPWAMTAGYVEPEPEDNEAPGVSALVLALCALLLARRR